MEKGKPENQRFQELIKKRDKRIGELEKEFIKIPRCKKYVEQGKRIYTKLWNELPKEMQKVFVKYSDTNTCLMLLHAEFYYDNGFNDCAELVIALKKSRLIKEIL